jgi:gliding motility-associated-like protein
MLKCTIINASVHFFKKNFYIWALNQRLYHKMKKIFSLFLFVTSLSISNLSLAQGVIDAGQDTAVCLPGSVTLNATVGNQNPTILSNPNNPLGDDIFAPMVINIGFPFTFFGNVYTQCLISTNNYITFNLVPPNNFNTSPYQINGPIPGGQAATHNAILGPWQDLLPAQGGTIRYALIGTAPNRIFAVEYCSVAMYSCTALSFSSQIQLHENGSVIETHIIDKPICATWNGGQAIHGIQNNGGTIAFVNAGRNAGVQWAVSNEGTRFQPDPNDPNNYFVNNIPFSPVTLGASGTITWSEVGGGVIGTGTSITVNPAAPTAYVASIDDLCSGFQYTDTVQVNAAPVPDLSFFYPSATFCLDTIIVTPTLGPGSVGDFSATPAGIVFANTTTGEIDLGASSPGTFEISRIGTNGGCYDTLTVTINITSAPDPSHTYPTSIYCAGGTPPLPQFVTNASAGLFTATPAGLVFSNANTGEVNVDSSTAGTYIVTNTITGFGCPTTTDTSIVIIAEQSIDAGAALSTCTGLGALIQGIATGPNSNDLIWSGGTGVFSNFNNDTAYYNPSLNDAGVGFVNLVLTMNGTPTCPTIFDIVPLTVELGATASAGVDVNFCGNGAPFALSGLVGGLGTNGTWSTNGSGTFGNPTTLTTIYTPSAADIANGSVVIYLTTDDPAGNCPPAVDSLVASFSTQATISVQFQNSICAGSSANLTAVTTGSISSYQWTALSGTGTFTNPTSATAQYTPSAADIANGFIIIGVNGVAPAPCNNVNASDTILIIPAPNAVISGGGVVQTGIGTICPNGTSADVNIVMNGNGPFSFTYSVGTDTFTVNNATSPYVYQDSIPGPFNLISLNDLGACPASSITGSATIDTVNISYTAFYSEETCGEQDGIAFVNNVAGGNSPYNYLWNNATASTNDSISNLLAGTYTITITDANNCFESAPIVVPQVLGVTAAISADPISGSYPLTVNFTNSSTGAATYLWNFGDTDTSTALSPSHIFELQGEYQVILIAYNTPGCFASDTLTIVVDGEVPNIFTPNGDGSNDKFSFNKLSVKSFNAQIFNRWGKKVFEWTDPKEGWDGSSAEAGVYYYIVQMTTLADKEEELHGTITLLK